MGFSSRNRHPRFAICGLGPLIAASAVFSAWVLGSAVRADEPPSSSMKAEPTADAAKPPRPTAEQIHHWIVELDHDSYAVRQAAAESLLGAGTTARGPLLKVTGSPDPEIRAAARRIVTLIEVSDLHSRIEAFAADADGQQGVTLPGWDVYRRLVGDDRGARALFVEMQRQESALMAGMFRDRSPVREAAWEERLLRLVQFLATNEGRTNVRPTLGTSATMILLGSVPETASSNQAASRLASLIERQAIREAMQSGSHRDAFRRLVVAWIVHCPSKLESVLLRRLAMARNNNLREALPLALAVVDGEPDYAKVSATVRAAAVLLVGQAGGREQVERLEPLLEDEAVCIRTTFAVARQRPRMMVAVEMRDVALVVILHLTGQKPADYGYVHARRQSDQIYDLQTLFVIDASQRTAALAKWRAWKTAQELAAAADNH